ncbi:hypothetical protein [Herpetosiphon giganteus]|uniref:hypothetical protein n=1 Tax=Herpetosiphon giganteus TaxID=2029754 RepID=UPI00195AAFF5|nr:hypothetical protein [Herpetosiphon giganteus]MBM7845318.1 DMSO/TMAO reductase YedYZ heme-binding membrane subunit [Herpetosiphon giganteus]
MSSFLLNAHSGWRWIVMLAILVAVGYGLWGWLTKQPWSDTARKIMLFTTIAIDIQLLLGLALYVVNKSWSQLNPATVRFEHPTVMVLALGLAHVVNTKVKRGEIPAARYRLMALGTIAVLVLIVVGILRLPGNRLFGM